MNALFRNDGTRAFRVGFSSLPCYYRYRPISHCIFRTSFQPKRLDTISPFQLSSRSASSLIYLSIYYYKWFKKGNYSSLKVGTFSNVQPSAQDLQTFEIDHAGRVYLADESEPSPRFFDKDRKKDVQIFYSDHNFFMQNFFYLGSQY